MDFDDQQIQEEEKLAYDGLEVLTLVDEKMYCGESFEDIGSEMEDVTPDGKVKKRIIRNGYGNVPLEGCEVSIDYNAYNEYADTPFDSTYIRKRPHTFKLGSGNVIAGLDIAVKTMLINEKAQFLFHYDYAYGAMGCLDRIPPKSTVLFEIELKKSLNIEAIASYNQLNEEKRNEFAELYKYAQAVCLKTKELVNRNVKAAIKEYNIIATKLENSILDNYEEQEKQQKLLLRIYTNLLICYLKVDLPKKACTEANKINQIVKGNGFPLCAKVYFNHARALRMLNDFERAKQKLKQAQSLEPNNSSIAEEFVILEKEWSEARENEKKRAQAMFPNVGKKETNN